ncbi:putative cell division cycle ATPase [Harmonia axyridis]|uniref:putative cell division cycle ATPase n=1 Tax=Harmonia axyridis TaxID=115357 RepID=UPI001E277C95|nr:putative cell division cycle ATPase [Harmonia axyridis]XP_045478769.1 putative cell division cycle ATPase [Harmonia axyridis]XP_045478770.1 putative cell division cycle ATPase [Harmonia axyridis]XP_045478771.1 putative cell division cycle ATPase [Harmonia axyridis]
MTTPKSASKSKKSEQWNQCESCGTIITIRDSEKHQTDCPPNPKIFTHFYIRNSCLLGSLNLMNEESQDARDGLNKFVFLSQSCMQICDIAISNWTVLKINDLAPIVKRARPTTGKSLTSVHLTKEVLDLYFGDVKAYPTVSVTKLTQYTKDALVITLKSIGRLKTTEITPEIEKRLCYIFKRTILTNGNKISIFYFGRLLKFSIKEVKSENSDPVTNFDNLNLSDTFYEVTENTKWVLFKNHEETQNVNNQETISKVGGLTEQLNEIKIWMDNALTVKEEAKRFTNVLLVGSSGTGKTTLVNYLVNESKVNVEFLNSTKFLAQSRESLKKMFEDALSNAPTVMVFDKLDQICSKCSKDEQKLFLLEDLLTHLDKLNNNRGAKVFVIGITTDISNVAPELTKSGIFDHEINIPMPKPAARKEILEIVLEIYKHNITEDQLLEISKDTRGYVGEDLVKLCSRAKFTMLKDSRSVMEISDLKFAMKRFVPSGSKDFHVEVPNVKWSDIGGQEELKNLLKHCIKDILHPERYERMGKLAPKGVLMYGPPGCSKTTIAKALATESGFNFFSIKAAELFNKYVGESQQAIIKLFKRARDVSPSVIFFDEVDAIACMRGSESGDANNVQANVLMQLLLEIDGVSPLEGLIVLAATNRLDRLDTALYRGGRLMKVLVPLPDYETRMKIFELKFRKIPVKDIDIKMLVDRTEKCCGAYIEELCHSAARIALDENPEPFVTMEHFKKALETMTNENRSALETMTKQKSTSSYNVFIFIRNMFLRLFHVDIGNIF